MRSLICDYCNTQYTPKFINKRSRNHYCSKSCKDKHHPILYGSGETKSEYQKRYYIEHRDEKIIKAKARYAANPEEKKQYDAVRRRECHVRLSLERRAKYKENRNWEQVKRTMLAAARTRAKNQKVPFDIAIEDIFIPDICPVLGVSLMWNEGVAKPNSPSLDKIIPHLGYVKGNIAVMSNRANKIKNNSSKQEITALYHWITSVLGV